MKKLFILLITFSLIGCLGSKKVTERSNITKQTEKTEIKKDSSKIINTNKAISDKIYTPIPHTENEELNKLVEDFFTNFNTSKTSGNNGYTQRYNPKKRQLETTFEIGETKDIETNTNKETTTEKSFEQQIDEYIYKKVKEMPWWVYGLIIFVFRKQLIGLLSFFFPRKKAIKTFTDFKKELTPKIRSPVA